MTRGITFDTGALIALERRQKRMRSIVTEATLQGLTITIPAPVLTEWWRKPSAAQTNILRAFEVEPLTERLAKLAGEAIESVAHATPIDAIVMASAASRGDIVFTSDFDDLDRLRAYFPNVRVLRT